MRKKKTDCRPVIQTTRRNARVTITACKMAWRPAAGFVGLLREGWLPLGSAYAQVLVRARQSRAARRQVVARAPHVRPNNAAPTRSVRIESEKICITRRAGRQDRGGMGRRASILSHFRPCRILAKERTRVVIKTMERAANVAECGTATSDESVSGE